MATIKFNPNLPAEYYVLDVIYQIRTVEEALRTSKDIEMFGVPTTGFAQYDSQLVGSYTTCAVCIGRMAEIHDAGFYIGLVDAADAPNIYLSVQNYLEQWKKILDKSINNIKVPYELLYRLDRFAHLVYPSAAPQFKTDVDVADPLALFIESFNQKDDIGVLLEAPVETDGEPLPAHPARRSLQDDLLAHQARWFK